MKRIYIIPLLLLLAGLASALVLNNTSAITVTSAGTAVQLSATSIKCSALSVQARTGNAGLIYIGGSTVSASNKYGYLLSAGQSRDWQPFNTSTLYFDVSDFWVDAVTSNDGITWMCIK